MDERPLPPGVRFPICEMGKRTTLVVTEPCPKTLGLMTTGERPKALGPALRRTALWLPFRVFVCLFLFFKVVLLSEKFETPGLDGCLGFLGSYQPCPVFPLPSFPGQQRPSHPGRTKKTLAANPGRWGRCGKM